MSEKELYKISKFETLIRWKNEFSLLWEILFEPLGY